MTRSRNVVRLLPREDLFWAKVVRSDGCWEWTGAKDRFGYGTVTRKLLSKVPIRAHRLSWFFANGPVPDGQWVLHRCDNPPCVRPDHLFLGTRSDNIRDMFAKERGRPNGGVIARGATHPMVRLTEAQVREILGRSGESKTALAAEFRVARTTVGDIIRRRTWQHLRLGDRKYPLTRDDSVT